MRRLVFGLGSGRCGTASLAKLLEVPHEAVNLPWEPDPIRFAHAVRHAVDHCGSVSMTWLRYVPYLIEKLSDARFVCLQREKDATCQSWARHLGDEEYLRIEVLYQHGREIRHGNVFPDYGDLPVAWALPLFYDRYYEQAREYAEIWPQSFRIFPSPHVLNDRAAQRDMKRWAGRKNLPFRAVLLNAMETHEDPVERDARRLRRRLQRRLYSAATDYLLSGGDPARTLTLADLAARDPGVLPLFREVARSQNPGSELEEKDPAEIGVSFEDKLPLGEGWKPV